MTHDSKHNKASMLLRAYTGLEEVYAAFEQAARALEQVRLAPLCVEECGYCCTVNTPYLWGIEAEYILSYVELTRHAKLLDRCQAWLLDHDNRLTLRGVMVDLTSPIGRTKILRETALAAELPCPMYEADTRRCAIHSCRPLVCRVYGVTRLPSQVSCRAPLGVNESVSRRAHFESADLRSGVKAFVANLPAEWRASYFLPTGLYGRARPTSFALLTERIATAKFVTFPESPAVLWQEQLDAQWQAAGVR